MTAALLLVLAGCRPHAESDSAKGVDTGAPPDSHTSVESDSPGQDTDTATLDTHTGETADTGVDTDSGGDTDTAPPPCDRSLGWSSVAAGQFQTCGIHTDGCAECWGRGEAEGAEEWETGTYHWHGEDQPPPGEYSAIAMIRSTSYYFDTPNACGVMADASVACWGSALTGTNDVPAGSVVQIEVWSFAAFAITDASTIVAWPIGEPPDGSYHDVATSVYDTVFLSASGELLQTTIAGSTIETAPAGTFIAVGAGDEYACALRTDGSPLCWNPYEPENAEFEPMTTDAPVGPFADICVLGGGEACALSAEGDVSCWRLGGIYEPPEGEVFSQIACGAAHVCGVTPDGRIVCWGHDLYGETTPPT